MHQETFELNCSRTSLALDSTLVVVVEMSLSTWLVCAEMPDLERRAIKKMSVDEAELLSQLHRWRDESEKRLDCRVSRICVAYEAGRDGFWLVRFLRGSGIEAHVMHWVRLHKCTKSATGYSISVFCWNYFYLSRRLRRHRKLMPEKDHCV